MNNYSCILIRYFKKTLICIFFIYIFCFQVSALEKKTIKNVKKTMASSEIKDDYPHIESEKAIKKVSNEINELSDIITELRIDNIKFKNKIENRKLDLKLIGSSKFGDSIGLISILIGILTFVFTALVFVTGIGYYNTYKAQKKLHEKLEKYKDDLTREAKDDIKTESENYIKRNLLPETKDKIKNLELNFWALTNIARKLENAYWHEVKNISTIDIALDRYNKFKLAIGNILSQEDINQGLGYFYNLDITESMNIFEESLYKFHYNGLFKNHEEAFSSLIENISHMDLAHWLKKIKKNIEKQQSPI